MLQIGCPRFRNTEAFVSTDLTLPTSQALYCTVSYPLSIRKGRSLHHKLCIDFSVFDDDDGHKRGQTSSRSIDFLKLYWRRRNSSFASFIKDVTIYPVCCW